MEITNFKGLEVQNAKPLNFLEDNRLNFGLENFQEPENFATNLSLFNTQNKSPENILMKFGNNEILKSKITEKNGFEIENRLIKTHLPGIKQKNIMI